MLRGRGPRPRARPRAKRGNTGQHPKGANGPIGGSAPVTPVHRRRPGPLALALFFPENALADNRAETKLSNQANCSLQSRRRWPSAEPASPTCPSPRVKEDFHPPGGLSGCREGSQCLCSAEDEPVVAPCSLRCLWSSAPCTQHCSRPALRPCLSERRSDTRCRNTCTPRRPQSTMSARGLSSQTPTHPSQDGPNGRRSTAAGGAAAAGTPATAGASASTNTGLGHNTLDNSKFFHLFQTPEGGPDPVAKAPTESLFSPADLWNTANPQLSSGSLSTVPPPAGHEHASMGTAGSGSGPALNVALGMPVQTTSLSAPSSSQHHLTAQLLNSASSTSAGSFGVAPRDPTAKHQSSPNLWSSNYSASLLDESADTVNSASNPASNQSSVSAPGSAGNNANVFKLSRSARSSRSSRFFPSPMFESRNSGDLDLTQNEQQQQQQPQSQHQNIFTQSPLMSTNRRTTIPNTPSTSFNYSSPSGLNDPSQHNNDILMYDQNLKAGSTNFQNIPPISVNQNYSRSDTLFNSSTPTPQYDPPNVSYFDNKFNFIPHHLQQQQQQQQQHHVSSSNNISYSTLFGEPNSSTILSPQFSNNSSTPLPFNTDGQLPVAYNSNTNYQLSYHVNENSQILPTSSFVDRDLSLDNDLDINDLSELSFADSHAESPSPSPNSSPKKGIFQQSQNAYIPNTKISGTVKHKSKQKQKNMKEKEKLTFAGSHPQFTPTLNLTNLKYNKISLDSPHTHWPSKISIRCLWPITSTMPMIT